ncbi:MAG: ribonucleoside-diphosphate reductase subunit alpha, partial [Opitutae bacterium]|nr:ribonucleoside-diphosphate reductase subunit alpha [Opitutae bacterium]
MNPELPFYREDIALKNAIRTPANAKPRFNWRESLPAAAAGAAPVPAIAGFDHGRIAEIVGTALTDLLLSREITDIFTEQNRNFVAAVAKQVSESVSDLVLKTDGLVTEAQIIPIIEQALIQHNRHDVAKSLVCSSGYISTPGSVEVKARLMRRNHQIVPWNQSKIDIAI